ncbi:hypothetical protein BGZ54_010544 [Gamsiella multidivaricata]|nr:hypothetical protein BGZ54_010544 [Gamsiella multidivaricata]
MPGQTSQKRALPAVMIVGGGLGGLLMATLLERADIPYHIYERAGELRALGSIMTLGANVLPVFEQLGLLEEFERISKPVPSLDFYTSDIQKLGSLDLKEFKAASGYSNYIFARPRLYEMLRKQVPSHKVSLNKRVVRIEETHNKVTIFCEDESSYSGDILIGADGAYSSVRQSIFKQMDERGLLPASDSENLSIGFISMVGVSHPKNPEKYPQLQDTLGHYSQVLGNDSRAWGVFSAADNQISWMLSSQLTAEEANEKRFSNAEWGPEANQAMLNEFADMACPWGGKMSDIFEDTPKHLISKVFLEEKMFKTWYYGRTVLMGDACHKMFPGAGQGAVNAFQDAVVLANCLYVMEDKDPNTITAAFQEYYRQRFDRANYQYNQSSYMSKTQSGQYRPLVSWLPMIENRGTVPVLPQQGPTKLVVEKSVAL